MFPQWWRLILLGITCPRPLVDALPQAANAARNATTVGRERINFNSEWKFFRSESNPDGVSYDTRPGLPSTSNTEVLKSWILPSGNQFIKSGSKHTVPSGQPKTVVKYAQKSFDDAAWEMVTLPHDWAIKGPFYQGNNVPVTGGMGRLPSQGVGWYRKALSYSLEKDAGKSIYLDIDGAMSYAMVWVNGKLIGGWPYPYNSFRLDLSPHLSEGDDNLVAIRLDNPTDSSRWYPGGGLYRNIWITKVSPVHVAQWGTYFTTSNVSADSATVNANVRIENLGNTSTVVDLITDVHTLDTTSWTKGERVTSFSGGSVQVPAGQTKEVNATVTMANPKLWGPPPSQKPNLYVAVTRVMSDGKMMDTYETQFGIRSITYDANKGLIVNGEHIRVQGVDQHHSLGAIGSAFNVRAAERQLEMLQEVGCNAIRMSHNPPAPELLDMTDRMGFVVMDEIFDMWQMQKTTADQHLIFNDWSEPDLRAFLRRDRNHASIVSWSVGNEVGEQTSSTGATIGARLRNIVREEDPTRPVTASMNAAEPQMPFPGVFDVLSLNYQGEGIRDTPAYSNLSGRKTKPLYGDFHKAFPGKMIWSSETAAALSTRGTYIFPVTAGISAPVNDSSGGNSRAYQVSAYELYTADFGSSPDKVFATQDQNPFVAGEFVWSGWDYLGEPTPYYDTRSSYFGMIDLAGFKKDRFFLYQARWRPDLKVAHILPHWTWPSRNNQVTPVHVFTNADEAELFLNGKSQGRKKKDTSHAYRFRWDDIKYVPGVLSVVAYRDGKEWARDSVKTAGDAAALTTEADRSNITADGQDLSFVTVKITDSDGTVVPQASNAITFAVSGPGEVVATDNGDPADFTSFPSKERKAFSGLALGIIRATKPGTITVTASSKRLKSSQITLEAR